ncbi:MAG: NAD(P)-dependent alcohol dehydrogenase [Candidatus Limnocylindrales bacterium]
MTDSTTMRAAERDRYGPPQVVSVREVAKPAPKGDQILVRVLAASVNRADLDAMRPRWQFMRLFTGLRAPRLPGVGIDLAGVVEALGPEATRFKVGDSVFADLFPFGQAAFAEYVCVPENAFQTMPARMSFEEAATLPHSAVLAVQGLRDRRGRTPGPGNRVMIVGASGNVGPFAVQIAKALGAHVTAVASGPKLDFVRGLGADEVIDYTKVDYTRPGERYDWIVDVDAHHSALRWRDALRKGGTYVAMGGSGSWMVKTLVQGPAVTLATSKRMGLMLWWKPFHPPDVEKLKELIGAGQLKPVIDRQYPLAEVVDALEYVDQGRAIGKVVITP